MSRIALIVFFLSATGLATAQRPVLQPVDAPKRERIAEAPRNLETQPVREGANPDLRFTISNGGKQISIEEYKDGIFLTASIGSKRVWTVEDYPTADPVEPEFATARGWNVLLVRFGRAGMFLYDLRTGKAIAEDGHDWDITLSRDRKWGILRPYYSWISECYVASPFLRIAPDGKIKVIETTPMKQEQLCPPDRSQYAGVDAVVSPNNQLYAIVPASKTFTSTGGEADGIVELFQSSDNRKLASFRTKFPSHFGGIAFSVSNNYVVLKDSPESGQRDETQWLRISR